MWARDAKVLRRGEPVEKWVKRGKRWREVLVEAELVECVVCLSPFTRIVGGLDEVCPSCRWQGVPVDDVGRALVDTPRKAEAGARAEGQGILQALDAAD